MTESSPSPLASYQCSSLDLDKAYCFFCALSTVCETVTVLLTVHNLISMSLSNKQDIKIYVIKAAWVMMAPLKLHIYAVLSLLLAFIIYAFNTMTRAT